jgi:hypothetical protein
LFTLALALGCPVAELSRRLTSAELTEWAAYYNLDPWGEDRADLRAGIVAATIANRMRSKGEKTRKPVDFMPKFKTYGDKDLSRKVRSFFLHRPGGD